MTRYAKYYYELRALSEKDHAHFPVKPLDEDGLKKIEDRSRVRSLFVISIPSNIS